MPNTAPVVDTAEWVAWLRHPEREAVVNVFPVAAATRERFPHAIEVVAAWPREAIAQLGALDPATYIAVLTHDPKIDDEVLLTALEAEPAYIGAMGSKRAQASRRERLLGRGISEEDLQRISAPIGLDLGAIEAGEVAVSIMAEVLAVRHGRPTAAPRSRRTRTSRCSPAMVLMTTCA